MIKRLQDPAWWYWTATTFLLGAGIAGRPWGVPSAIGLTAIQLVHYLIRKRSFSALSVQVRIFYLALLASGQLPGMRWIYWLPFVGTTALVLFGYCMTARMLSLMPWNRRQPLTGNLVARTFLTPPVEGSFLDHIANAGRSE